MLISNPTSVTFANQSLDAVRQVAIDCRAAKATLDWSDLGPYPTFADVPERSVTVKVVAVPDHDQSWLAPGAQGTLIFKTSPSATDGARKTYALTAVVMSVSHDLTESAIKRTIEFAAISPDGAAEPITISDS
jgi:hypothetical protein